jgi:hypothetical protein
MYACMICMYVCMHDMYVCIYIRIMYACVYVRTYVCTHACHILHLNPQQNSSFRILHTFIFFIRKSLATSLITSQHAQHLHPCDRTLTPANSLQIISHTRPSKLLCAPQNLTSNTHSHDYLTHRPFEGLTSNTHSHDYSTHRLLLRLPVFQHSRIVVI